MHQFVGGLIGTATQKKDGLLSKSYAVTRIVNNASSGKYYLFKLSSIRYTAFRIIATTDDGRFIICVIGQSGYANNPFKCAIIKKHSNFTGTVKFYRKSESTDIYIQLFTGSNSTSMWVKKIVDVDNTEIQIEESSESVDSLIEVVAE